MAESADGTPYSWLVDPAVLVALTRLERANPARSIVPDPNIPDQQPTDTATATPSPSPSPEPSVGSGAAPGGWDTLAPPTSPTADPTAQEVALAESASAWLNRFRDLVGTQPVLTLPFGDLDVSAAVRNDRSRLDQAVARSTEVMRVLRLPSRPAVAPTDDLLSPEALQSVSTDTVVLLGDSAFDLPPETPNSVVRMLGHKVLVTSTAAESGGPGPTAATDPLAMRQRLLSEAALRALDDDSAPLIITMPAVWRGEDAAAFFDQLEQPWLDIVPVEQIADDTSNAVGRPASALNYTTRDQATEIGAGNFTAATRATNAAGLLEQVLSLQTTIEAQVRDEALVTLSEQHRSRPAVALRAADRVDEAMADYLDQIKVEAPGAVTLFSASGKLGATLVNNLDQPVTVQVAAATDGEVTISGLEGQRTLGPAARTRAPLRGVHRAARRAPGHRHRHRARRRSARLLRLPADPRGPGQRPRVGGDGRWCARALRDDRLPPPGSDPRPPGRAGGRVAGRGRGRGRRRRSRRRRGGARRAPRRRTTRAVGRCAGAPGPTVSTT